MGSKEVLSNIAVMEKMLDVKWKRHELLSNNLANEDTPGYKRQDISFEEKLKANLNKRVMPLVTTDVSHINNRKSLADIRPTLIRQDDRSFRNDENNVDVDKEMVEFLKNSFSYNILSDQVQMNFSLLHSAINEGR